MPGISTVVLHADRSEEQAAASGVPLGLVRLAAGTEDTADLIGGALAAADTERP